MLESIYIKTREFLNKALGKFRRHKLLNQNFTIISNNCWAGHVYRFFGLPYQTPTIGLYFFSEDYLKFVFNLKYYLSQDLVFISYKNSKYRRILEERGGENIRCPIGVLGDIEIIFLHYKSCQEASEKWNRRKERIIWDNIFIKFSQQNLCSEGLIRKYDTLPIKNKIIFVTRDYKIKSQIIFSKYKNHNEVANDITYFRKYVDLISWINQTNI